MLNITNTRDGSTVTVRVEGRVDSSNAAVFEKLALVADTGERLILADQLDTLL